MEYRPSWKRKVLGWALLFIGVLGVILPILHGMLFLALGLFVLRHQYAWAHRGMLWFQRRWPRQVESVELLEIRLIARLRLWGVKLRRAVGLA